MRRYLLLCVGLVACSSEPDQPSVVVATGVWTADFLVNTTTDGPGDDLNPFGTLTLVAATYDDSEGIWVGNATFEAIAYAAAGSLANPDIDPDGLTLYENVGTIVYRGTWSSDAYEGNTSFEIDVNCEEVALTSDRNDLQAVCGDPFIISPIVDCERPDGGTTLQCRFGGDQIVFSPK